MKTEKIKVLVIEPKKIPYVKEIENTLEELQSIVGGYIEPIYQEMTLNDNVILIANEEGKLLNLPFNRFIRGGLQNIPMSAIHGTFFLVSSEGEEFVSLPDDMIEKYTKFYTEHLDWPIVEPKE